MAVTYSELKVVNIVDGTETGTWGQITDANLTVALQEAIVGRATATFTADQNLSISLVDQEIPESQTARNFVLNVVSNVALSATRDLVVPPINKPYIVQNNTTGGQSIRIIVGSTGVTVPNGKSAFVYNDSTGVTAAFDYVPSLQVGGALDVDGTLDVGGNLDVGGDLDVNGNGSFSGTGQVKLPAGTTAERSGSPINGMLRYNSDIGQFEGYASNTWGGISGAQAGGAIVTNKSTATVSYTIASGENGFSVGPLTVASGVTITVDSGQRWVVI